MAICCIGLSLRCRAPIMIAWSSPGAALLITRLPGEAIGTYSVASGLIVLSGLTGTFDRLMRRIAGPCRRPVGGRAVQNVVCRLAPLRLYSGRSLKHQCILHPE
jgi:hypothetical protein